jgi:hypothetical protein
VLLLVYSEREFMGTNLPKAIGRYELVEHLTGGPDGFFRARDPEGDRDVAVLLVPAELIGDATIRVRVLHQAQTAAGLRHPHLAAILSVGEDAGGQLYVVTEPLRGGRLAAAWWAAGFATPHNRARFRRVAAPRRYSMGNWLATDSTAAADVG